MTSTWFRETESGVEIFLHCQPGSKKTEVQGIHGERLKIRLAAPPVDGKANEILIAWLANQLGIPKAKVQLTHGLTGRQKRVQIIGGTVEQLQTLQSLIS